MARKRRPQKVCVCSHAKSRHWVHYSDIVGTNDACEFCYRDCMTFTQDNLRTLERLSKYNEEKEIVAKISL